MKSCNGCKITLLSITSTDYTKRAAPIVVVRKSNGSISICLDYSTGFNVVLKVLPNPNPEPFFSQVHHFPSYCRLSPCQIAVGESFSELLTINTQNKATRGKIIDTMLPVISNCRCKFTQQYTHHNFSTSSRVCFLCQIGKM